MKYRTKKSAIEAARAMGSSSKTFNGARSYLLAHVDHPLTRHIPGTWEWRSDRRTTRSQWYAHEHSRRLCVRYVGAKRLPRYLSESDRTIIRLHPAMEEMARLTAMPSFARAHYLPDDSPMHSIPRFSRFIREAEVAQGELVTFSSVATHAYRVCDFGRTRRNHKGFCSLSPGIRTESYQRGRNPWGGKWTHNDYYADYTLIRPPDHGRVYGMYYVAPDRQTRTVYVSPSWLKIGARTTPIRRQRKSPETKPLPVHVQRRILVAHVSAVLRIDYDRTAKKLMLIDSAGEQYHLAPIGTPDGAHRQVREAVSAFRKRRAERIAIKHPERIWVSVEDSYAAGNCRSMTDQFAAEFHAAIGALGPVCARADLLLSIRDDNYTRRAISYAATRA